MLGIALPFPAVILSSREYGQQFIQAEAASRLGLIQALGDDIYGCLHEQLSEKEVSDLTFLVMSIDA